MANSYDVKQLREILMPCPGDMIIALHDMLSWNSVNVYAPSPGQILKNEHAIVLQRWMVGNNVRLITIHSGSIRIFSCKLSNLRRNWSIISLI